MLDPSTAPTFPAPLLNRVRLQLADYTIGAQQNVRRTEFDSGAVKQSKINSKALRTREANIWVFHDVIDIFLQWAEDSSHDWFQFTDWHDQTLRVARVQNGIAGVSVQYVQDQFLDGERYWAGQVTLEGYF